MEDDSQKTIEVEGSTVEEAIKRALEILEVTREEVIVKIKLILPLSNGEICNVNFVFLQRFHLLPSNKVRKDSNILIKSE